jgi:hypothetical protein
MVLLMLPAGKVVTGYQNRKAKEAEAKAAWETAAGRSMDNGWKDEYVTVIITLPLLQIFIGNLLSVWFPQKGQAIIAANTASMTQIGELMETPYGEVMMIVVLAAVGIKGLKALR